MGNCHSCCEDFISTEHVSTKPAVDRTFKSRRLSAPIKENKAGVDRGYKTFSENETKMEILSRQATAISRKVMAELLTTWSKELKLDPSDYDDLKELFDVAENDHWPQHLKLTSPWETTQTNNPATTNWMYFYVSRTGTDADLDEQKFNLAICHLITGKVGISRNVLIGGLCKKDLLLKDGGDVYLNFQTPS